MTFPLSSYDLRTIADTLDRINVVLWEGDDFVMGEGIGNFSIPLLRPDSDDPKDVIGYAVLNDGWAGFSPFSSIGFDT